MCEQEKVTYKEDWIFVNKIVNDNDKRIIRKLVLEKKNLLITGDRRSGKTSLLTWITKQLDEDERIILFDFHNEIHVPTHFNKLIRAGYKDNADIKGDPSKLETKSLVEKTMILPYDRIIADELYGSGTEQLLDSIHQERSVILSITSDSAINALKFVYLSTIYPEGKFLSPVKAKKIAQTFDYAITLGDITMIEEISFNNGELLFTKFNQ